MTAPGDDAPCRATDTSASRLPAATAPRDPTRGSQLVEQSLVAIVLRSCLRHRPAATPAGRQQPAPAALDKLRVARKRQLGAFPAPVHLSCRTGPGGSACCH